MMALENALSDHPSVKHQKRYCRPVSRREMRRLLPLRSSIPDDHQCGPN